MNKTEENYIDHEVRIRLLQNIAEKIDVRFNHMETKMDSNFRWTIGTIGALMISVLGFMITLVIALYLGG